MNSRVEGLNKGKYIGCIKNIYNPFYSDDPADC